MSPGGKVIALLLIAATTQIWAQTIPPPDPTPFPERVTPPAPPTPFHEQVTPSAPLTPFPEQLTQDAPLSDLDCGTRHAIQVPDLPSDVSVKNPGAKYQPGIVILDDGSIEENLVSQNHYFDIHGKQLYVQNDTTGEFEPWLEDGKGWPPKKGNVNQPKPCQDGECQSESMKTSLSRSNKSLPRAIIGNGAVGGVAGVVAWQQQWAWQEAANRGDDIAKKYIKRQREMEALERGKGLECEPWWKRILIQGGAAMHNGRGPL